MLIGDFEWSWWVDFGTTVYHIAVAQLVEQVAFLRFVVRSPAHSVNMFKVLQQNFEPQITKRKYLPHRLLAHYCKPRLSSGAVYSPAEHGYLKVDDVTQLITASSVLESPALHSLKGQHWLDNKVLVNGEKLHVKVHQSWTQCERCVQVYCAPAVCTGSTETNWIVFISAWSFVVLIPVWHCCKECLISVSLSIHLRSHNPIYYFGAAALRELITWTVFNYLFYFNIKVYHLDFQKWHSLSLFLCGCLSHSLPISFSNVSINELCMSW